MNNEVKFINQPIVRGFTEIKPLHNIISKYNAWICGGYARYVCSKNSKPAIPEDVDVFCKTEDDFNKIKEELKSLGITKTFETKVSISHHTKDTILFSCPKIQLIKPRDEKKLVTFGSIETILSNFDYTITRCAIISETECIIDEDFVADEEKRMINIKNIHCPISAVFRLSKYLNKGYHVSNMTILKLFLDWQERDQDYKDKIISYLISQHLYLGSEADKNKLKLDEYVGKYVDKALEYMESDKKEIDDKLNKLNDIAGIQTTQEEIRSVNDSGDDKESVIKLSDKQLEQMYELMQID